MKLKKSDKAVIYVRVSSEKQIENYSLDFQEKSLRRYAQANNIQVMKIFREEGCSGTNTSRPAYKEMIEYLEENSIDAILVHKLDRLHRDERNMFNDIKRFRESNIRIIAVADGIDTSDESATLATAILAAIGANFSRNLSKETRKGLYSAAENCLHTGGKPPYGFKVNDDTGLLEIDKTTAPAVRKMFELYADGFGISDIIEWLRDNGYKTSRGNDFKPNAIHELFHNEKYRGCYTWDKSLPRDSNGKRNAHKYKDSYLKIEDGCPRIVSDEVFYKVQERLIENADKAKNRTPDRYYPLTGMIFCSCGSVMCGGVSYSKGKRYHKYNCNNKCGSQSIRADYLEAFVINAITSCLFSEPNRPLILSELNKLSESTKMDSDKEYQQLKSKLSGLETSHENLMKALEKGKATNSIMNRLERIEQQKEQTLFKVQNLTRDTHIFTESELQLLQERFSEYLQVKNSVNNKYFLKNLIDRIIVNEDTVNITLKSGISIDKSTKIIMKGNDNMIKKNIAKREFDGILLGIESSGEEGIISLKLALSTKSNWCYDTDIYVEIPEEYLYNMAEEAEKDVLDILGLSLRVKTKVINGKIINVEEMEIK